MREMFSSPTSPTSPHDQNLLDGQKNSSAAWEFHDITLERGTVGLGFCVQGEADPENPTTYISKIIDGGSAASDGRLKVKDIITHVDNVSIESLPHDIAVKTLKQAGNKIHLKVKRRFSSKKDAIEVELRKGKHGLGLTIAGGIGSQHIPGDNGIYVTSIIPQGAAANNGIIKVGDRLVAVKKINKEFVFLENFSHKEAVEALACKVDETICLVINKDDNQYPLDTLSPRLLSERRIPPVPSGVREDVRTVELTRGPVGFGFNIIGGERAEGIFISFLLTGGPAHVSGKVRIADQIIGVNGINLVTASNDAFIEASEALKNAGDTIRLKLKFMPEEYKKVEEKLNEVKRSLSSMSLTKKKSLYVRSLFDYDPSKDEGIPSRGLMFKFGDILHVTNASDEEWWQARKVLNQGDEGEMGLVPSRSRWERKVKARDRSVRWRHQANGDLAKSRKSPGIAKKLPFIKKKEKNVEIENGLSNAEGDSCSQETRKSHTYRDVQKLDIDYSRPVVILGLLRDWLSASLASHYPESFHLCLLHTTRARRDGEVDGVDYHFVDTKDAMDAEIQRNKFVSVGKFNGNYYGTNMATVRATAEAGKHGVLNIPPHAIRRLRDARIHPIVIFVRPTKWNQFLLERKDMSEDKARERFETVNKLEKEFWEEFSAVVEAENKNCIYEQVKCIIASQSEKSIWLSINENIKY